MGATLLKNHVIERYKKTMLKIAITTLIALTSTVSAMSIRLRSTRSGLQIAEAELNAVAEILANPGLVSTQ